MTASAPHILVICTANICRSPVVAALLSRALDAAGHAGWTVSSAGTMGVEGWAIAEESAAVLAALGVDAAGHRSTGMTDARLAAADLVLGMQQAHIADLPADAPAHRLGDLAGEPADLADPYGDDLAAFEAMARDVERLVAAALPRIIELAWSRWACRRD